MIKVPFNIAQQQLWKTITPEQKKVIVRCNMQYIVYGMQTSPEADFTEFLKADDLTIAKTLTPENFNTWITLNYNQKELLINTIDSFINLNMQEIADVWEGNKPASWNPDCFEYTSIDYDFSEIAIQEMFASQDGSLQFTFLNNN
jgi:alpha-glucosidase (family GH31 glycosyl hydrolase)